MAAAVIVVQGAGDGLEVLALNRGRLVPSREMI